MVSVFAQESTIGVYQRHGDIGNPFKSGTSAYDPVTQIYTLSGAGYNIWLERDEFHYLHNKISGTSF